MNKCDKFENLCSLYIDDMLLNTEIEELLEHLDSCDRCHDYYADLKRTKDSLKNLKIEYPEDLTQSILDKLQQNREVQIVQYSPPKRKIFYGLLATCACLAIVISTTSFSFSNKSDTTAELTMSTSTTTIERASGTPASIGTIDAVPESSNIANADYGIATIEEDPVAPDMPIYDSPASESSVSSSALAEPEIATFSHSELLLDDYAFVYEFEGTENIEIVGGKILHYDDNLIYLEIDNTISLIEGVITTLEENQYELMEVDQNEFRISTEATSGIFIIHKN